MPRPPFTGAVLVGGASRRMGADKAFIAVAMPGSSPAASGSPPGAGTTPPGREVGAAGVGFRRFLHQPPRSAAGGAGDGRARPLAAVVRAALVGAGAGEVLAVGAAGERAERLRTLGLRPVPDARPGEGPLGGLLTALDHAAQDTVAVLACDLPGVTAEAIGTLLDALDAAPDRPGVIAVADGRDQPLLGVWRRHAAGGLRTAFAAGERSLVGALATVDPARVGVPAAWAHNVNTPGELYVPPAGER